MVYLDTSYLFTQNFFFNGCTGSLLLCAGAPLAAVHGLLAVASFLAEHGL